MSRKLDAIVTSTPAPALRFRPLVAADQDRLWYRGFGRPLMLEALEAARRAGYRKVSLTVHSENPARHLYERCGFREIDRRNTYRQMVAQLDP